MVPFFCPGCKCQVILKKGQIKIHHFSHLAKDRHCEYGSGESEIHYKTKIEIYEALKNNPACQECEIEKYMVTVRPDVIATINGHRVAIEIQKSKLPVEIIEHRMREYSKLGVYVIWVFPSMPNVYDTEYYRPDKWEKYIHGTYFGRVYYHAEGCFVRAAHFCSIEFNRSNKAFLWSEGSMDLVSHFRPTKRKQFHIIAAGNIWVDKFMPWWR